MGKAARTCAFMAIYSVPSEISQSSMIRNFVMENETSVFHIGYRPNKQFRIEGSMHQLDNSTVTSSLIIKMTG